MRHIEDITEHDMVAVYLKTEITSERWAKEVLALLKRDRVDRKVVDEPDTTNQEENEYRGQLLGDYRGYKQDRKLFELFLDDVSWYRKALTREELASVRYIDYSYWNELSSGSRSPVVAAKNIIAGIEVFGQTNQMFIECAEALKNGTELPELILVGTGQDSELTVLEGHVRLTAYLLAIEYIPEETEMIVGFSSSMDDWE